MPNRRSTQLLAARQFSPGLRLDVDAFQLADGESPDLKNVDLDPRGGVNLRGALVPLNASSTPMCDEPHSMFAFATTGGTEYLLIGAGKGTFYTSGSSFTAIDLAWTSTNRQRAATHKDVLYIQNGVDAPRKWSGSTATALTQTFNDNLASPDDGDMPIAKTICGWQSYVWVANTYESSTQYGSRVRFSHPNRAEDWRTDDYIDIDVGRDGDQITALVPLSDRLLVFKNRSVHAITGYDADTFAVHFVAEVGTPAQESVCQTEYGVYFFSWPDGMYVLTDRGVQYQFDALFPAIRDGDIPDAYHAQATVGWLNRRVWLSVPWNESTTNSRTFILTPGKGGGWTMYDRGFGPFLQWKRRSSETQSLAACATNDNDARVYRVDQSAATDTQYTKWANTAGRCARTDDAAWNSITSSIDVRVQVTIQDVTSYQYVVQKWVDPGQKSWKFEVGSDTLYYTSSTNGSSETTKFSSVSLSSVGLTVGTKVWLRVVHNTASTSVLFYYSYNGTTWTQIGSTRTSADASIYDSTSRIEVNSTLGYIHYAELRNGVGGSVVGAIDFTSENAISYDYTVVDAYGNTWTLDSTLDVGSTDMLPYIDAYYMTRWFDAGSASVIKRWKRPDIVMDADDAGVIQVEVYRDYEPSTAIKSFNLSVSGTEGGMTWGSGVWGTGIWGGTGSGSQSIERGSLLGRGRAIALKFIGPSSPSVHWSVNSINMKYIPRRVR